MDYNSKLKMLMLLSLLIVSAPTILALGISSPYWQDNPLKMYPGQVKEIPFTLVNGEKEDAQAFVALSEGKEIAEITSGTEYLVSSDSTDKKIILKISIPRDAKTGDSYSIRFSIKSSPQKEAGTVQLNVGYNVNFPVSVVSSSEATVEIKASESEKTQLSKIIILLPLVIIAVIIFIILYKSRRIRKQV